MPLQGSALRWLFGCISDMYVGGYNHYVRVIGGAIGVGACANVRRENPLNGISDSTNVLHFLSETEEEGGGNDCLFLVIADIVSV